MMNLFQAGKQLFSTNVQNPGVDVFSMLNGIDYVIIDQEERWWDLVPCCIFETKYRIYPTNNNLVFDRYPKPPPEIGSFTEDSDYIARQITHSCRKYTGIFRLGSYVAGKVVAPFKCHCPLPCMSCPCDRPIVYVSDVNDRLIGTIRIPGFGPICCAIGKNTYPLLELEVVDCQGNVRFAIKAEYCQKSNICSLCRTCGCEHIDYNIYDAQGNPTGGFIKNVLNECMTEVFTSADTFAVCFPPDCFPQDKLLIMQATIFIDFLQYRA